MQHVHPQFCVQIIWQRFTQCVRMQTVCRHFLHIHIFAAQNRVNGAGHTKQIDLERPRFVVHHFGADEIRRLQFGGECSTGKEVQIDRLTIIDELQCETIGVWIFQSVGMEKID